MWLLFCFLPILTPEVKVDKGVATYTFNVRKDRQEFIILSDEKLDIILDFQDGAIRNYYIDGFHLVWPGPELLTSRNVKDKKLRLKIKDYNMQYFKLLQLQ